MLAILRKQRQIASLVIPNSSASISGLGFMSQITSAATAFNAEMSFGGISPAAGGTELRLIPKKCSHPCGGYGLVHASVTLWSRHVRRQLRRQSLTQFWCLSIGSH